VKQADNTVSPEPNIQRWEQQKQKNNANSTWISSFVLIQKQNGMSVLWNIIKPNDWLKFKSSIGQCVQIMQRRKFCV
jgi:hypothetical protein